MATTFDGDTLRIILEAPVGGVLDINVQQQLYSEWKVWVALATNTRYPAAFRTTGGDSLTPGVEQGAYFFLRNDFGWRIISSDDDQTINYLGNLVGQSPTLPLIVPTPSRTVLHLGLQPVTQRVDEILEQGQDAQYLGAVAIDTVSGVAGTEFPTGTIAQPVNNITDARTIADNKGFKAYRFREVLTLNANHEDWDFLGIGSLLSSELNLAGFSVDGSNFESCTIDGNLSGTISATLCGIRGVQGLDGAFIGCGISENVSLATGVQPLFKDCASSVPGDSAPTIDCANALGVQFRNWSGGLILDNIDQALFAGSIDLDPGSLTLTANCVDGAVLVRGVGTLTDNSAGTGVVKRGLLDTIDADISFKSAVGNADVSGDDLTVEIKDADLNVVRTLSISADGRIRRIV